MPAEAWPRAEAHTDGDRRALILFDARMATRRQNFPHAVELCDPSGKVLGRFVPIIDVSRWDSMTPEISDEELDRRFNSNERRYTTAEVLAHLNSL